MRTHCTITFEIAHSVRGDKRHLFHICHVTDEGLVINEVQQVLELVKVSHKVFSNFLKGKNSQKCIYPNIAAQACRSHFLLTLDRRDNHGGVSGLPRR